MTVRTAMAMLAACCLMAAGPAHAAAQDDDARAAAEAWLAFIDARDYAASWEAAASSMQNAVTAEQWAAQLSAGHAQLGEAESRELAGAQTMTDPPGAPPGEYVQLRYDSEFSGAGRLTEMVIVVKEGDRGWRVAGYFLQPPG